MLFIIINSKYQHLIVCLHNNISIEHINSPNKGSGIKIYCIILLTCKPNTLRSTGKSDHKCYNARDLYLVNMQYMLHIIDGGPRDHTVVGCATTCTISAYQHQRCEFKSRSDEMYAIQHL